MIFERACERLQALFVLREKIPLSYGIRPKQRRSTMDILKKIWNTSVTVGQVIVTAVIGLTIGLVIWVLVRLFRPSKN